MNDDASPRARLQRAAAAVLARLRERPEAELLEQGRKLVGELRRLRDFETMGSLAETVTRHLPGDATARRLYAQSLIETGHASAAVDVLRALSRRLRRGEPEWAEARGLVGRAFKQIFSDAGDKTHRGAIDALHHAIDAYREPFEADPDRHFWHGVNLVALLVRAGRLGTARRDDPDARAVALRIVRTLETKPPEQREPWDHASLAEAHLGLGHWDRVERHLHDYVASAGTDAFALGGTLRQLVEIWDVEAEGARGAGLVGALRAALMSTPGGEVDLSGPELQRLSHQPGPETNQLEAILGHEGPVTWRWWQTGLERARSVCAVREQLGGRIGTGFLVRAADLGLEPGDELLVMTNHHVVNDQGVSPGLPPDAVEIAFDALEGGHVSTVREVAWRSPVDRHDACLMRLDAPPPGLAPLPLAKSLPVMPAAESGEPLPRVYVIGHPGGRELSFSFQDNELLDHEGPPRGVPPNPDAWRVHYRAPTEGGSSGSPVFNARLWQVIALHHMGGRVMPRLNGQSGTYAANQGIAVMSIAKAVKA